MSIIDFFIHQIQSNQFASASIVATSTAMMAYAVKGVPINLYYFVKRNMFSEFLIMNNRREFEDVLLFISEKVVKDRFSHTFGYERISEFKMIPSDSGSGHWKEQDIVSHVSIGQGSHFGIYKGRPVLIRRRILKEASLNDVREELVCRFLGANKTTVNGFISDVFSYSEKRKTARKKLNVFTNKGPMWTRITEMNLRSKDSIFVKENIDEIEQEFKDKMIKTIKLSLNERLWLQRNKSRSKAT